MVINNLSIYSYFLKNSDYPVLPGSSLTVLDATWAADDELARTIESLDNHNLISVDDRPVNYPRTREFPEVLNILGGENPFVGGTITTPLYIDNADTNNAGLTVDAAGSSGKIALLRKSDGKLVAYIGSTSGIFAPGSDKPTLELSKDQLVVNLDPAINGFFAVSDIDGNTLLDVEATGGVTLQPAPGSIESPFRVFTESGSSALAMSQGGTTSFFKRVIVDLGAATDSGPTLKLVANLDDQDNNIIEGYNEHGEQVLRVDGEGIVRAVEHHAQALTIEQNSVRPGNVLFRITPPVTQVGTPFAVLSKTGVVAISSDADGNVFSASPVNLSAGLTVGGNATFSAVGFYGNPAVAQPALPITLGDVIAALQDLGLVASV